MGVMEPHVTEDKDAGLLVSIVLSSKLFAVCASQ